MIYQFTIKHRIMNTATCTKCGQTITEIVNIGGLPYGTTCAANKLGFSELPAWFKGGDWDSAKIEHDNIQAKNILDFDNARRITSEFWDEWQMISQAKNKAYQMHNDWLSDFFSSIIRQLGYSNSLCPNMPNNFQDAENSDYFKYSIPYLYNKPKHINELSQKQLNLINKYL